MKNRIFNIKIFVLLVLGFIFFPRASQAVVPPDFIFNIGSQIAQAFSVVIVFLSAVFVTMYQFLKVKIASLKHQKAFWIISITLIVVGSFSAAVFYTAHEQKVNYNKWLQWFQQAGQKDKTQKKDYFYDRIIVLGKDKDKQNFSLVFEGSRQEIKEHLFGHTYSVSILYKNKLYKDFSVFNGAGSAIQANQFVTAFSNTSTKQLPTETYRFSFRIKDKDFNVDLHDLESDFLVKNSLDYMRYVSVGAADVYIDGDVVGAKTMVDKVLSNDSSIPTLEGYDPRYTSHSLALWDEQGNFYHIDTSKVFSENIPYASHTWILHKDVKGTAKKVYNATLDFNQDKKSVWNFVIPELDGAKIRVESTQFIKEGKNLFSTLVQGTVSDTSGERTISGYAFYDNKQ